MMRAVFEVTLLTGEPFLCVDHAFLSFHVSALFLSDSLEWDAYPFYVSEVSECCRQVPTDTVHDLARHGSIVDQGPDSAHGRAAEDPARDAEDPVRDAQDPVRDAEDPVRDAEDPVRDAEDAVRDAEDPVRDDGRRRSGQPLLCKKKHWV